MSGSSVAETNRWITGAGGEAIPQIPPAILNAVFKITGKRFRSIPLKNHDLSWADVLRRPAIQTLRYAILRRATSMKNLKWIGLP
jgi:hypothetical protein